MDKIERQKITEREELSFDEKEHIAAKSNHKCCHCGKEVYFGYGATIEHFIPISKGGTNRDVNLVMLCKQCNIAKADMVLKPEDYLTYLNEEDLEKLKGYFESYKQSFEYVTRGNLLSCDQYKIYVEPNYKAEPRRRHNRYRDKPINNYVILKRATIDDIPRLADYFEAYVKKYDCYKDRETVDLNIRFWFQFGCIYYIEGIDGITVMACLMVTDIDTIYPDEFGSTLSMSIFAYYDTSQALTLCNGMMYSIPRLVMKEQGLWQIPIRLNMVQKDKTAMTVMTNRGQDPIASKDGAMAHQYIIIHMKNKDELPEPNEDEALAEFFKKFSNVEGEVRQWLGDNEDLAWMMNDVKLGVADDAEQGEQGDTQVLCTEKSANP